MDIEDVETNSTPVEQPARSMSKSKALAIQHLEFKRVTWQQYLRSELQRMCVERGIPFMAQPRKNPRHMRNRWEQLRTCISLQYDNYPLFTAKDFLNQLVFKSRTPPKTERGTILAQQQFSSLDVPTPEIDELCVRYAETIYAPPPKRTIVERLLTQQDEESRLRCLSVLRSGRTAAAWRAGLWQRALESNKIMRCHDQYWLQLRDIVCSTISIYDQMLLRDVHRYIAYNGEFFVFENQLYQVLLCFSRDADVVITTASEQLPYELPGIVPFAGLCRYAVPFSFLYEKSSRVYFGFRAMYSKYFHHLANIDAHPQGIVALSLLYERLLTTLEPDLWQHFKDHGISPLRVVFKWLMRAFSGYLASPQLVIVWDLIIGYNSLEILPLMAVCVLISRKESLLKAHSTPEIGDVLSDLTTIVLMPILEEIVKRFPMPPMFRPQ